MKVFVTGGTGFLGRHVVRSLVASGHEVTALVRSEAPELEQDGARLARGDVLVPETLATAIAGAEAVIHMAGRVQHKGEPTALYELHVEGTRNTIAAATAAQVKRVVHVSTSGTVAVSSDSHAVARDDAPYTLHTARRWPYYLSKIFAEKLALEAHARGDVSVVVVNPSLLLGPGDETLSSSQIVLRFLRREIPAAPPGGINFVDVRDAAHAVASALEQGEPGTRYLLGGPNMTIDAFFVLLGKVCGIPAPGLRASARVNDLAAKVLGTLEDVGGLDGDESVAYAMAGYYWYLDAGRAKRELTFDPRSPEATLKDAVAWIRSQGPIQTEKGTFGSLFRGVQRVLGRA